MVEELSFRRTSIHVHHDARRLEHGEDLNDALLDFFVKLGQALIPCGGLEGGFPSVAYLGSLFFDVLRSRGATDGRAGHTNVAGWARRRLGQGGLFFDGIGALAVPVNEMLGSFHGGNEKHWWLALLLNPRAGGRSDLKEQMSVVCLDSLARAEFHCNPAIRSLRGGHMTNYPLEVTGLARQGVFASVKFKALGDGSVGPLVDPKRSRLTIDGREFGSPRLELSIDERGEFGKAARCEGSLEFGLESTLKTCGEYTVEFGGTGMYGPTPRLCIRRQVSSYQKEVARFLGGYMAKEWETGKGSEDAEQKSEYKTAQVESQIVLPDVPQQETANDCGYFILEQILMALQLTPEDFRTMARASASLIATLPWPSQKDVERRKERLREALEALFEAAEAKGNSDVEVLIKDDPELRKHIQEALWDGPRFTMAARQLAAMSAPREKFSIADLGAMSTKQLRTLCTQHGVLPPGTVERADLLRALIPVAAVVPPAPEPKPVETTGLTASAAQASARPPREAAAGQAESTSSGGSTNHLGSVRFTVDDLGKMPLKTLRSLCVQHGVLPPFALEQDDFIRALTPLASAQSQVNEAAADIQVPEAASPPVQAEPAGPPVNPAETLAAARAAAAALRFTVDDLAKKSLKELRSLCSQYQVTPHRAMERGDFERALIPLASDHTPDPKAEESAGAAKTAAAEVGAAGATSSPSAGPDTNGSEARGEKRSAEHLGSMRFTMADLEQMPVKTLRGLCVQHRVLPACAVERSDFVKAIAHLATDAAGSCQKKEPAVPEQSKPEEGTGPSEGPEERKAKWQRVAASGEHLGGLSFDQQDLDVMPMKILRGLCGQHKVLPSSAVERADFVEALRPLIGRRGALQPAANSTGTAGQTSVKPARTGLFNSTTPTEKKPEVPKRDFSKFLGAFKPTFTAADLDEMPEQTLRTLCMQHGVLPQGEVPRDGLLQALTPLAVRSERVMHYDELMQMDG